jgi:hypothetical protein
MKGKTAFEGLRVSRARVISSTALAAPTVLLSLFINPNRSSDDIRVLLAVSVTTKPSLDECGWQEAKSW